MYIIQLSFTRSPRIPKYLKAHQLRGGRIVTTRHQHCARKFKSEAEAQEFVDKLSIYYLGYVWTVVPFIPQSVSA
jgi:hypothetical protein